VGAGAWGKNHIRVFFEIPNVRLKYVCDQDPANIEPVSYLDMLQLEKNAKAILTDSGGVQKESYWLGVPCFTLREETERVETIKSKWNSLVGTEAKRIVKKVMHMKGRGRYLKRHGIFGNGKAGQKIVQILMKGFG